MSANLPQRDWILISAYLDGRLSAVEKTRFESRLESDLEFKQATREIQYTRRMLRSLPQKRAPRNFTLTPMKARVSLRQRSMQPVFSFVSAAAALAFVVLFVSSVLLPSLMMAKQSAAPMMAAPQPEAFSADEFTVMATEAPAAEPDFVAEATTTGMPTSSLENAAGGGPTTVTETPMAVASAPMLETPTAAPSSRMMATPTPETEIVVMETPATKDIAPTMEEPATLMMDSAEITSAYGNEREMKRTLPPSTIWMISLAALSLLCGGAALYLRRR